MKFVVTMLLVGILTGCLGLQHQKKHQKKKKHRPAAAARHVQPTREEPPVIREVGTPVLPIIEWRNAEMEEHVREQRELLKH